MLKTVFEIDWSRYRLTKLRTGAACAVLLMIAVSVSLVQFISARDNILPAGTPLGGDYVAFYGASIAAASGDAATIYEADAFEQLLITVGPPRESYRLTWQYPPTYYFVIAPLSLLPFAIGYALWTGLTAAFFFTTLRLVGFSGFALFVALSSPSIFHATITGQNGFLTATLLFIAALYPDKRPILAGVAAALLTVKPQLGLLLPIAYLAGGHWRAFTTAAGGALAFAGAATAVFGFDIWAAFLEGASQTSERLALGIMPVHKMVTPFATLVHAGAPASIASGLHITGALITAAFTALVWRSKIDQHLKAAALCAGVFFVAPYGFYYELALLALPALVIAERAQKTGWLKGEQAMLAAIFFAPITLPGVANGLNLGLICVMLVAFSVIRRITAEAPELIPARKPVTATPSV